jgi:hypothetical protein
VAGLSSYSPILPLPAALLASPGNLPCTTPTSGTLCYIVLHRPGRYQEIKSPAGDVAGSCTALRIPLTQAGFSFTPCPVLRRIALPVVSEWCQLMPVERKESLHPLRFRLLLGDGARELEVVR